MKLITKIRKADHQKKTAVFEAADLSREEAEALVREMILSLPGYYKLHGGRDIGRNLVDAIYDVYGWWPSMLVSESMIRGLACLYPKKVYATFTLGLDVVEIK